MSKYWEKRSQLKSKFISDAFIKKNDSKSGDFEFKPEFYKSFNVVKRDDFILHCFNFGVNILKLEVMTITPDKEFVFSVSYFNPQTEADCNIINHILMVAEEYSTPKARKLGNADVFNNQYVFRLKKSYYSYTRLWTRGEIDDGNYNAQLSYDFATDEYITFIKNIFQIKKIQKRKIKSEFKGYLDKYLLLEKMKSKEK